MMPGKNNNPNQKTRKSPTPTAGHNSRDRTSPSVNQVSASGNRSQPQTPTHPHATSAQSPRSVPTGGRERQPSPKVAVGTAHPSPKQTPQFNPRSRPIKAFTDGPINDSDLLSQSEYLDGREMDSSRSVLLESPAAKSILGGEVARQKHEFYMSQSRMAAHQESGHESNEDDTDESAAEADAAGPSVVSHAIIDKVGAELEAASNEELSVLMEHVHMLMEQRSRREPNGNIIPKPIVNSIPQPRVNNNSNNVVGSRQNIPSPFKAIDPLASDHHTQSQPAQPQANAAASLDKKAGSGTRPYVHNAGAYQQSPGTASGSSPEKPANDQEGLSSTPYTSTPPMAYSSVVPQPALPTTPNLLSMSLDGSSMAAARSQLRRSLSGDATHIRSTKDRMHPLATGYHVLGSSSANSSTNKASSKPSSATAGAPMTSSNVITAVEDEEMELSSALGRRPTPTKSLSGVVSDRTGAVPPTIMEAWPSSPGANYRPSPPILESTYKPPIHSPKVKKHRAPLHPPTSRPVPTTADRVGQQDDDSSNTDSLTLQSFEDPIVTVSVDVDKAVSSSAKNTSSTTAATIPIKRSKSYGDESSLPGRDGREAAGLVTSPNTAFDDFSVGSGNSASNYSAGGSSVRSHSSRSVDQQSATKSNLRTMYSFITNTVSRM